MYKWIFACMNLCWYFIFSGLLTLIICMCVLYFLNKLTLTILKIALIFPLIGFTNIALTTMLIYVCQMIIEDICSQDQEGIQRYMSLLMW